MLYNPSWKKSKTADPFALTTLIAWLEKQPQGNSFSWRRVSRCPLTRYFKEAGCSNYVEKSAFLGNYYSQFGRVIGIGSNSYRSTYGEALQRARALLAEQQS